MHFFAVKYVSSGGNRFTVIFVRICLLAIFSDAGVAAGRDDRSPRRIFFRRRRPAEEVSRDGIVGRYGEEQGKPVPLLQVGRMAAFSGKR